MSPRGDLLRLFEAARWAPSSRNEQPWRFVVASPDAIAASRSRRCWRRSTAKNQAWAAAAPVLVLVAVRLTLERDEASNPHAWYDAGQAVALLTLQATAQGLSIRQMAGLRSRARARGLRRARASSSRRSSSRSATPAIPSRSTIEKHRDAERQPRERRPLGDFVFEERWGSAVDVQVVKRCGIDQSQ